MYFGKKEKVVKKIPLNCLHLSCPSCKGTGVIIRGSRRGQPCIHMISCKCSKCNPHTM